MSRGTRRIIFYLFVLLFIAVGTAVVSYSQGWRFDFKTGRFEKTGGIYLKIEPSDAVIDLDSKQVKNQSSIFQSGTLISDLTKGKYAVEISKDGYYSWEKNIDVEPGAASVFDKIILLPRDNAKKIDEAADNFVILEGKAVETKGGVVTFGDKLVRGNKIVDVSLGGKIITRSGSGTYYLTDLTAGDGASLNVSTLFSNLKQSALNLSGTVAITAIDFHSFDDSRLVIETAGGLYILDTKNLSLEQVASNPLAFTISGDQLVWVGTDGVWSYNLILRSVTQVSDTIVSADNPAIGVGVSPSGSLIAILQKSGRLTLVDYSAQSATKIADKVKEFAFSPNSHYLAYADYDGPLVTYRIDQPGYIDLNPSKESPVSDFGWYKDSAHLIALREGKLNFIEVDTSLPVNGAEIAREVSEFYYDGSGDILYYLSPTGLFSFSIVR